MREGVALDSTSPPKSTILINNFAKGSGGGGGRG